MRDLNFNPGIGLGHLIVHKNKYIGKGYLMVEHESNGKDSIFSRSWNKITLAAAVLLNKNWEVQFKGWIPIVDGKENKDILKYNGIFQVAANYRTDNTTTKQINGSINDKFTAGMPNKTDWSIMLA